MKTKLISYLILLLPLFSFSTPSLDLDSLNNAYNSSRNDTEKIKILAQIAFEYKYSDPEKLYELSKEILDRSKAISFQYGIAKSSDLQGSYYYIVDDYFKALDKFEHALKLYQKLEDTKSIADIYNRKGLIYEAINQKKTAIKAYHESLILKEQINDKKGISNALNNIGIIYLDLLDYENAKKYFDRSLLISLELNHSQGISRCYNNIGIVHNETGDIDKALEFYLKSVKIQEKDKDNIDGLALSYNNIGSTYTEVKKLEVAMYYYDMALPLFEKINSKSGLSLLHNNISEVHFLNENFQQAISHSNKALNYAKEIKKYEYIQDAYNTLYHIYKFQKDYEHALQYKELLDNLADSLQSSSSEIEISLLNARYEYELEKKSIQKKKLIDERLSTRMTSIQVLIVIESILLILLAVGFVLPNKIQWNQMRVILFCFALFGFELVLLNGNPLINQPSWDRPIFKILFHLFLVVLISIIYQKLYSIFLNNKNSKE